MSGRSGPRSGPNTRPITDRQAEALLLLQTYEEAHGRAPTVGEAAKLFRVRSANALLSTLGNRHLIDYVPGRPIRILATARKKVA